MINKKIKEIEKEIEELENGNFVPLDYDVVAEMLKAKLQTLKECKKMFIEMIDESVVYKLKIEKEVIECINKEVIKQRIEGK